MKNLTESQLREVLIQRTKATSQAQTARDLKIAPSFLNDLIQGKRTISEAMASKLGYQRIVIYKKAS